MLDLNGEQVVSRFHKRNNPICRISKPSPQRNLLDVIMVSSTDVVSNVANYGTNQKALKLLLLDNFNVATGTTYLMVLSLVHVCLFLMCRIPLPLYPS